MVLQFCGATIMVKSTKQSMVRKSSTESELIAFCDYCTVVMEVHNFLSKMGLTTKSNLLEFTSIKARLEYGELGKMVDTITYPTLPPVTFNPADLSPASDPHGPIKKAIEQRVVNLEKDMHEMNKNKVKLNAALIWGKMSVESRDIVKLHADYTTLSVSKDTVILIKTVIDTHSFTRTTTVAVISRRDGRDQYHSILITFHESLPVFKERDYVHVHTDLIHSGYTVQNTKYCVQCTV